MKVIKNYKLNYYIEGNPFIIRFKTDMMKSYNKSIEEY